MSFFISYLPRNTSQTQSVVPPSALQAAAANVSVILHKAFVPPPVPETAEGEEGGDADAAAKGPDTVPITDLVSASDAADGNVMTLQILECGSLPKTLGPVIGSANGGLKLAAVLALPPAPVDVPDPEGNYLSNPNPACVALATSVDGETGTARWGGRAGPAAALLQQVQKFASDEGPVRCHLTAAETESLKVRTIE